MVIGVRSTQVLAFVSVGTGNGAPVLQEHLYDRNNEARYMSYCLHNETGYRLPTNWLFRQDQSETYTANNQERYKDDP